MPKGQVLRWYSCVELNANIFTHVSWERYIFTFFLNLSNDINEIANYLSIFICAKIIALIIIFRFFFKTNVYINNTNMDSNNMGYSYRISRNSQLNEFLIKWEKDLLCASGITSSCIHSFCRLRCKCHWSLSTKVG